MKLIIDIDEKAYKDGHLDKFFGCYSKKLDEIIYNGIPLEEKTGHWIEKNVNKDGTHNIYCSNCNNFQKFKGHANSYNARTKLKYCPYCGAKMEGE